MQLVLLFLAVIPVVVILTYIYRKDKNKEPGGLLVLLFLMGIASCFMVLFVSDLVFKIFPFMNEGTEYMTFFEVMAYAFIGVALVEEFCKFFMTFIGAYRNKAYDEVYDGIVYAVYVSLGFAFFENLLYVFTNQSIGVGIARGLLAVPGHACDAVFMGYYLSVSKVYSLQGKKNLEIKNLLFSILIPTILHGIYDFCLFTGNTLFIILFLVFVVFMYIGSLKKIKQLSAKTTAQQTAQPQPVNSNNQVNGFTSPEVNNNYIQNNNFTQPIPNNINTGGYIQNNQNQLNVDYIQNNQNTTNTGYIQNNNSEYFQYSSHSQYANGYVNTNNQQTPLQQNKFCGTCGSPVNGSFCGNCGARQN